MKRLLSFLGLLGFLGAAACDGQGLVTGERMPWVRFVDAKGNVLASKDGLFSIRFPAGAVKEGVALEIRQVDPDGGRWAGRQYQVHRIDGGPADIALKKAATVTLRWVDTAAYVDPPQLGRVGSDGAWVPEPFVRESGKLVGRQVMRTGTFGAWDACADDRGCAEGLICEGGACGEPACRDAAGCGAYQDCTAGRCVDRCGVLACTPGVACDDRNACDVVDGCPRCVPVQNCDPAENCLDGVDNDCDGKIDRDDPDCEVISCAKANGNADCPRDTYCVEGTCRDCRDNYDCTVKDPMLVCPTSTYTCEVVIDCRSDLDCPPDAGCWPFESYTMCISCPPPDSPDRCDSDLDCMKGTICEHWGHDPGCGLCFPAECSSNANCPDGEQCLAGRCRNTRCTDQDLDGYPAEADCGVPQDCNDASPSIYPGARERCNNIDDDCNGFPDDDDPTKMCQAFGGYCRDGKCF